MATSSRPTRLHLPAPPTPAESLTAEQSGNGGLAHLTMQSATEAPTAITADRLPGIWGAGQAASVPDLHEVGTRALSDSVQAGQRDLRLRCEAPFTQQLSA